jgi:hypothetical protein
MITNDEAMDTVCDAMTLIGGTSYESEDDYKEAKTLVSRLIETIKWVEIQVEGQWEEKEN